MANTTVEVTTTRIHRHNFVEATGTITTDGEVTEWVFSHGSPDHGFWGARALGQADD